MSDTDIVERAENAIALAERMGLVGAHPTNIHRIAIDLLAEIARLSSALDRATQERGARDREILSLRNAAVNLLDRAEAAESRLTQAVTRERELREALEWIAEDEDRGEVAVPAEVGEGTTRVIGPKHQRTLMWMRARAAIRARTPDAGERKL